MKSLAYCKHTSHVRYRCATVRYESACVWRSQSELIRVRPRYSWVSHLWLYGLWFIVDTTDQLYLLLSAACRFCCCVSHLCRVI